MTVAAHHQEDTFRSAVEALTVALDAGSSHDRVDLEEFITELTNDALELLTLWPPAAPDGEVRNLLILLKRARDAYADDNRDDLRLIVVGMKTVLARLRQQGRHAQIEKPSEALDYLDSSLDGWTADDLARVVGAQPRVLTNWRSGTQPRSAARERLMLVTELVADLRNTMTARGVRMWFDNPVPKLGNRSPQQLLDEDAAGHRTALVEFVRGGLR